MRVVVAAVVSEVTAGALRLAARIAGPDGEVVAVHAMNPSAEVLDAPPVASAEEAAERQVEQRSRDLASLVEGLDLGVRVEPVVQLVYGADAAEAVNEVAEERDAEVIVVGSKHAAGLRGLVLGSTAQKLLRISARPVLVVPPRR